MAYLLCEAHFWTLKQQTIIPDDNIGCFAYHQKNDLDANNHSYNDEKVQYTEGRDVTWRPRNKRPVRLREALQEVEELMGSKACVGLCWLSRRLLQVYLSNGTVVTCNVSTFTGDVDCLHIDKSIVNKLSVENASAVILSNAYMMLAYSDRAKVDYVAFLKQPQLGKRIDKLSSLDPRVITVDIPGPSARKLERKFVSNQQQSLVVCWWSFGQVEVMPWTPVTGDREKVNLVLLSVGSFRPETVCYARTAGDLISVQFSEIQSQQIHTVEQATTSSNEITAYICVYECDQKKLQRLSAISIPLQTSVTCTDRCSTEDHVLLGCGDSSIVLYDSYRKVTQSAKCAVVPSFVSWHPSGCIFIVISSRGDIQVFDVALSPLHIQFVSTDLRPSPTISLSTFLKSLPTLCQVVWNPQLPNAEYALVECNDLLSLVFDRGPVVMMSFYFGVMNQGLLSALQLVNQYIRTRQLSEAIDVLSTRNWNSDSRTSFACLSTIVNHLLKLPLDPVTEDRIQETLGLFYSPAKPLTEATILRYRDAVGHLARRFFHVLLRYSRFEKAFLLAVDIGARDLFMDIHFAASDRGETVLAQVARQKADQLEAESLTGEGSLQYGHSEESLNSLEEHYNSDDQLDSRITDHTLDQELQYANSLDVRFQSKRPQLPLGDMQDRSQQYLEDGILGSLEASLSSALKDEFTDCFLPNKTQASSSSQDGVMHVVHFGIV